MKRPLLLLLAIAAAVALLTAGCRASKQSSDEKEEPVSGSYEQITQEKAAQLMKSESDYVLLDVRTVQEFSENHIPGAICIPNENIGDEDVPQLPDKNALILVYCRSGNRSKQAAEKLARAGYTNVKEFGGIIDWTGPVSAVE